MSTRRSMFLPAASKELIAKVVNELRHDADTITTAIARLKQDLRRGGGDDHRGRSRADL
jgi:hypothetical protein